MVMVGYCQLLMVLCVSVNIWCLVIRFLICVLIQIDVGVVVLVLLFELWFMCRKFEVLLDLELIRNCVEVMM